MHRSRLLVILGVLAAAASLALPFATFPIAGDIGGIEAAAWPALVLLVPVLLLFVAGDRVEAPARPVAGVAMVLAIGGLTFAIVKVVDAWMAAADAGGSMGPGAWVLAATTGMTVLGVALGFSRQI